MLIHVYCFSDMANCPSGQLLLCPNPVPSPLGTGGGPCLEYLPFLETQLYKSARNKSHFKHSPRLNCELQMTSIHSSEYDVVLGLILNQ